MEEVVETVETWPADPANAFELAKGEFKCVSAPAIPLTQVEETQRKNEAKLAAAKKHRRHYTRNLEEKHKTAQHHKIFQPSVIVDETGN
ncbi:hypothetical protein BLNAU_19762 [Blattamonas nauphoetae]|uniref:Uncharacterized protein n=1 Tax=Blattamonas nauphoetae TaxID=2049346 RepID=A0ABQ9X0N2_9EUKA|nr:hypothetical protein BLNAU_19762 [Blattamonas nauphoetae]